jgi:hypothetical protein
MGVDGAAIPSVTIGTAPLVSEPRPHPFNSASIASSIDPMIGLDFIFPVSVRPCSMA